MEIRWMRSFLAVAEELNYSRAAERLHIVQPAVTQHIRQLERSVGTPLFVRTTRSVALTSAGEAFLEPCRRALAQIETAERLARAAADGHAGHVRIGFAGIFASAGIARIAREVREAEPDITLEIRPSSHNARLLEELLDGSIDIGLYSALFTSEGIRQWETPPVRLGVLVAPAHPLTQRASIDIGELRTEPFVLTDASAGLVLRDTILETCRSAGFMPIIAQESGDAYSVLTLVAAGIGISLGPDVPEVYPSGVRFIPLLQEGPSLTSALGTAAAGPSAAAIRVLDIARAALGIDGNDDAHHTEH
ncbi:LysR substrate-binding domain-containing protein [Rhodococcus sp. NCIMB 12038]|uniref:LysR family transcriptional regulator n=1 Tax=Rhodococcus sp. NCIMB 12038 TaxID=933800 RepID=UPI0015C6352F|nr:LysR substrate-binding domain-containing protein [Rhodococcus sp. NCIMB 12038]